MESVWNIEENKMETKYRKTGVQLVISKMGEIMGIRELAEKSPTKALDIVYCLGKKNVDVMFFSDASHYGTADKVVVTINPDIFSAEEISNEIKEFLSKR